MTDLKATAEPFIRTAEESRRAGDGYVSANRELLAGLAGQLEAEAAALSDLARRARAATRA